MPIVVEYLFLLQNADTFCDSEEAFNRLLQVDSTISLKRGKLRHKNAFECDYRLTMGRITGKDQRYFHCRFSIDGELEKDIDAFSSLLRSVRCATSKIPSSPETLWDDISFHYSRQAYEHIYRIENLMRKLISNFMLVTVGSKWISETSPKEIAEAIEKSRRKQSVNVLQAVDFSHLTLYLLKPYPNKDAHELCERLKEGATIDNVKQYIPESNWNRYFSALVECDDRYLQKKWSELYDLRCKVAHNSLLTKAELESVKIITSELEVKLKDAINKLPKVKVPQTDVEQIAADAATNTQAIRELDEWFSRTDPTPINATHSQYDGPVNPFVFNNSSVLRPVVMNTRMASGVLAPGRAYYPSTGEMVTIPPAGVSETSASPPQSPDKKNPTG